MNHRFFFYSSFSLIFLSALLLPKLAFSSSPLFRLDSEWKLVEVNPGKANGVRSTFIKKSKGPRGLSAVVATEKSELSLEAYGKAVKKLIVEDPKSDWRKLGTLKVHSGKALLAEVEHPSPYGPITMLQLITKRDGTFFVLTVAAGKDEFVEKRAELMEIVRSFELAQSPLEWLDTRQSTLLTSLFDSLKKSAEKRAVSQKTPQRAAPYTPEEKRQVVAAALEEKKEAIEPCKSVLLDQLDQASLEHKGREIMSSFFASEAFQKRLWPQFGQVIHKHFGHLGPAWELEALLFIQREFVHLPQGKLSTDRP